METIFIPSKIVDEARKRGIDINELILEILVQKLNLDPRYVAEARLELAKKFLEEARVHIKKGDPVQASKKLYKVVEECIKALAERYGVPEAEEARREGRWWTKLLSRAAKNLSKLLREPLINIAWSVAYDLNVWGFHESSLSIEHVEICLPYIEQLLERAQQLLSD